MKPSSATSAACANSLIVAVMLLLGAAPAGAATYVWDGGGGATITASTGANWCNVTTNTNDDTVPPVGSDVIFGGAGSSNCIPSTGNVTWNTNAAVPVTVNSFTLSASGTAYTGTVTVSKNLTASTDVSVVSGTLTGGNVITTTGDVSVTGGTFQGTGNRTINGGDFTVTSPGTVSMTSGTTSVRGTSTTSPSLLGLGPTDGVATMTLKNLTIGGVTGGTAAITQSGTVTVSGNMLVGETSIAAGASTSFDGQTQTLTVSGTLKVRSDVTTQIGFAQGTSTFNAGTSGGLTVTDLTSVIASGSTNSCRVVFDGQSKNLTFNGGLTVEQQDSVVSACGLTYTPSTGTNDVNGAFTFQDSDDSTSDAFLTWADPASAYTMTVSGDFTLTDDAGSAVLDFTPNVGTITLDGTSADQTLTLMSGASFNNLTLNNTASGGSDDVILAGAALDVNGDLTITDGDLDLSTNDQNVTLAGSLSIASAGSVDTSAWSGTWTFDGSGTSTWSDSSSAVQNLGAVTIDGSSKTINLSTNAKATSVSVGANDTLGLGSSTLTITGSGTGGSQPFTVSGTLTEGSGTVAYAGTAATDVENETYSGLTIAPSSGSPTFSLTGATTVSGTLTVSGGTLSLGANNLTASGAITNTATINESGAGKIIHAATSTKLTNSSGTEQTSFSAGDSVFITLIDEDENLTSSADTVTGNFTVSTTNGDSLTINGSTCTSLQLTETSGTSETFRNSTGITSELGAPNTSDCVLQLLGSETITVAYTDTEDATDTGGAAQSDTASGSGTATSTTAFTDTSGTGITTYILGSTATGTIFVTVTDADENSSSSSQQTVTATVTSSGTSDTVTLTLTETGNDTGAFRNASGLSFVTGQAANTANSTLETQDDATLTASYTDNDDSSDATTDTATINAGADLVLVTTSVNKTTAKLGDTVLVTVTAKNQTAESLAGLEAHLALPAGLTYRPGSARLESAATSEPTGTSTRTFSLGTLTANQTKTLTFQLLVTSAAGPGTHTATLQAVVP